MDRITYVYLEADFISASKALRVDPDEIVDNILDFDDEIAKLGLAGYIDISKIMRDVFLNGFDLNVGWRRFYKKETYIPSSIDYYADLSDMVSSNMEDIDFNDEFCFWCDEDALYTSVDEAATLSLRVYNYLLMSLARNISEIESDIMSEALLQYDDYNYHLREQGILDAPSYLDILDNYVIIPCMFDKDQLDERYRPHQSEEYRRIYSNYCMSPHR